MMLGGYIYYGFSLLRDSVLCKCYNSVVPFCYPQTFSTLLKLESQKLNFLQTKSLDNMSTTRSQKRKNVQQEVNDNVSEGSISPINLEGPRSLVQEIGVPGPSRAKSPRIENSFLESLRSSLKEEITSEIKNLLVESQKEMLKLLRTETRENVRNNVDEDVDNETRSFYTPTKTVRINSTQNDDTDVSRNTEYVFESCLGERARSVPSRMMPLAVVLEEMSHVICLTLSPHYFPPRMGLR